MARRGSTATTLLANQTLRFFDDNSSDMVYDAENRLVEAKRDCNVVAQYVNDGDGNKVKSDVVGTVTVYIGKHYERSAFNTLFKDLDLFRRAYDDLWCTFIGCDLAANPDLFIIIQSHR